MDDLLPLPRTPEAYLVRRLDKARIYKAPAPDGLGVWWVDIPGESIAFLLTFEWAVEYFRRVALNEHPEQPSFTIPERAHG